jgi:hypothetical protein
MPLWPSLLDCRSPSKKPESASSIEAVSEGDGSSPAQPQIVAFDGCLRREKINRGINLSRGYKKSQRLDQCRPLTFEEGPEFPDSKPQLVAVEGSVNPLVRVGATVIETVFHDLPILLVAYSKVPRASRRESG